MSTKQQNETEHQGQTSRRTREVSNTCVICKTEFISVRRSQCCSEQCRGLRRRNKQISGTLGKDYINCPACEQQVKQITLSHVKRHGFDSVQDFKNHYSMEKVTCEKIIELHSGENNPGYQHGGKFSKFSKNFIHGYDKQWHDAHNNRVSKDRQENPHKYPTSIEYWQKKYPNDSDRAKQEYAQYQTRDLAYFISKYGEEEGRQRHQKKIERWTNSMPRYNYSEISQELFDRIMEKYDCEYEHIFYATFDRADIKDYQNKEYRLSVQSTYVMPDFIDLHNKKIIEFDGDYWHSNAVANPEREKHRDLLIRQQGYEIFHVQERRYKQDKQKVIQECLDFLNK